jgi:hypothetical protein
MKAKTYETPAAFKRALESTARAFLDPVLGGPLRGRWSPSLWKWSP